MLQPTWWDGRLTCPVGIVEFLSGGIVAARSILRRVLRVLPALAVVDLHPVVFAILHFARILERLSKEFAKVVVVWRVFESEVADVRKVFVKLLCEMSALQPFCPL